MRKWWIVESWVRCSPWRASRRPRRYLSSLWQPGSGLGCGHSGKFEKEPDQGTVDSGEQQRDVCTDRGGKANPQGDVWSANRGSHFDAAVKG